MAMVMVMVRVTVMVMVMAMATGMEITEITERRKTIRSGNKNLRR